MAPVTRAHSALLAKIDELETINERLRTEKEIWKVRATHRRRVCIESSDDEVDSSNASKPSWTSSIIACPKSTVIDYDIAGTRTSARLSSTKTCGSSGVKQRASSDAPRNETSETPPAESIARALGLATTRRKRATSDSASSDAHTGAAPRVQSAQDNKKLKILELFCTANSEVIVSPTTVVKTTAESRERGYTSNIKSLTKSVVSPPATVKSLAAPVHKTPSMELPPEAAADNVPQNVDAPPPTELVGAEAMPTSGYVFDLGRGPVFEQGLYSMFVPKSLANGVPHKTVAKLLAAQGFVGTYNKKWMEVSRHTMAAHFTLEMERNGHLSRTIGTLSSGESRVVNGCFITRHLSYQGTAKFAFAVELLRLLSVKDAKFGPGAKPMIGCIVTIGGEKLSFEKIKIEYPDTFEPAMAALSRKINKQLNKTK